MAGFHRTHRPWLPRRLTVGITVAALARSRLGSTSVDHFWSQIDKLALGHYPPGVRPFPEKLPRQVGLLCGCWPCLAARLPMSIDSIRREHGCEPQSHLTVSEPTRIALDLAAVEALTDDELQALLDETVNAGDLPDGR